jgi:hypothetical protein
VQQGFTGGIDHAVLADLSGLHLRVCEHAPVSAKAHQLSLAGLNDARTDGGAGFTRPLIRELVITQRRNIDVQIDAIEQRPADACAIALDRASVADALRRARAVEAVRTSPRCLFAMSRQRTETPSRVRIQQNPQALGDLIRRRRLDLSLLQRESADAIGVEVSTYRLWEWNRTQRRCAGSPALWCSSAWSRSASARFRAAVPWASEFAHTVSVAESRVSSSQAAWRWTRPPSGGGKAGRSNRVQCGPAW